MWIQFNIENQFDLSVVGFFLIFLIRKRLIYSNYMCVRVVIAKCESEHQFHVLLAVENVKFQITVITNRSGRF